MQNTGDPRFWGEGLEEPEADPDEKENVNVLRAAALIALELEENYLAEQEARNKKYGLTSK